MHIKYNSWYNFSFRMMRTVRGLNLYAGVEWYALFNNILVDYIESNFSEEGIAILPTENGRNIYYENEIVNVLIGFDNHNLRAIENSIEDLRKDRKWDIHNAHLIPGKTIELVSAENVIKKKFPEHDVINEEVITKEIQSLENAKRIKITLLSPLRFKRPEGFKESGHVFCDPYYFDAKHFIQRIAQQNNIILQDSELENFKTIRQNFIWLDVPYKKTMGGILGGFEIEGSFSDSIKRALIIGQYSGVGKNNSFGFGFYRIESDFSLFHLFSNQKGIIPLLFSEKNINKTVEQMHDDTKGAFGVIPADLYLNQEYIHNLSQALINGTYKLGETKSFRKKKKDGSYREIIVSALVDRVVLKVLHNYLHEILNDQLSENCYAYRKGYDYHQAARAAFEQFKRGFAKGLSADIKDFFGSISMKRLELLTDSFFSGSTLSSMIKKFFLEDHLFQGNVLSPILSNFYLAAFDIEMHKLFPEVNMIRYADDILLFTQNASIDLKSVLVEKLRTCHLNLNEDKTRSFGIEDELEFLGYQISKIKYFMQKGEKRSLAELTDWLPVFLNRSLQEKPLYITFSIKYARTQSNKIILHKYDGSYTQIYWKEVNRIVILGKPRISAGIIRRALFMKKGVVFLTALGKMIGGFNNFGKNNQIHELYNDNFISWNNWCEIYIKELVKSKIYNQQYLLRKNNCKNNSLKDYFGKIDKSKDMDSVRGLEGAATKEYYQHYRKIVHPFPFKKRCYHPAEGPINAMLSFYYTLLYRRLVEILISSGINSYVGIFHSSRGNHHALASDLLESFRFLADRNVVALIRLKQITLSDFEEKNYKGVNKTIIKQDVLRAMIHRFEHTMNTMITFEKRKITYLELMEFMVHRLKVCLYIGIPYKSYKI